jgi:hypothetical protein
VALTRVPIFLAVFAGPLGWLAHNLLSASLVSTACRAGGWSLDVVTLICATLAGLGLLASGGRLGGSQADGQRLLAWTGVLVNGFFLLAVIFEGVPSLLLNPCWS